MAGSNFGNPCVKSTFDLILLADSNTLFLPNVYSMCDGVCFRSLVNHHLVIFTHRIAVCELTFHQDSDPGPTK
jgi:hypothetical protein